MISLATVKMVIKADLVVILLIIVLFTIFNVIISAKMIIFGRSMGGIIASAYLLIVAVFGMIIISLIFKKEKLGTSLCFLYFLYHILDTLITNGTLFQDHSVPLLRVSGFLLTIILIVINKYSYYQNQKKTQY